MSIGADTLFAITASATLAIFSGALALLVIWQDPCQNSNRYFALCMLLFTGYGTLNALWQVPQQFDLPPALLLNASSALYVLSTIALFNFSIIFAGVSRRQRRIQQWFGVPLTLIVSALLLNDSVYTDFVPLDNGRYNYAITDAGMMGILGVIIYLILSISLLNSRSSKRAQQISFPIMVLVAGITAFAGLPALRFYAVNALAMTATAIMIGRIVLEHQVFEPLRDLNQALIAKNQELAEATRMKSQFLANMSHELRTPLNSIIGYTELVINHTYGELNETQENRLEKVTRNGRVLLELINDVLDLSKIEAGRMDLHVSEVPASELLDSVLHTYEVQALNKGLRLVRGYDTLPSLKVDENRARQIIANLLSNAIKFTEKGAIIVRGHVDDAGQEVTISVTDTGVGIAPAIQERIFEAFQQGDNSLTRPYEGTGLGLAIAQRLTEMHGGRLWFNSILNRGTTFHVALPAAGSVPELHPISRPERGNVGPVILTIDDDCEFIEMVQDQLNPRGYRVWGSCNANEGLRLAHSLQPRLIMLDVRMPGMDGWQVLDALRSDPETVHIPILIVTAADISNLAQRANADGYLPKPIKPRDLIAEIYRLTAGVPSAGSVPS